MVLQYFHHWIFQNVKRESLRKIKGNVNKGAKVVENEE